MSPLLICSFIFVAAHLLSARTEAVCWNSLGDDVCQAERSESADYCWLHSRTRCGCAQDCQAASECNDPEDTDVSCDCPFNAPKCETEPWMISTCNRTCTLRDSGVTCPRPTEAVSNASLLYNGVLPGDGSAGGRYMDEATYGCLEGFIGSAGPSKPLRRLCVQSGVWVIDPRQASPPLVCQRVSCGVPPAMELATPSLAIGYFRDHVTYQCDPDVTLRVGGGAGGYDCAANGTWLEDGDTSPLCLGLSVKFVSSQPEIGTTDSVTPSITRSKLECASQCARRVTCPHFLYDVMTGQCRLNTAPADRVMARVSVW